MSIRDNLGGGSAGSVLDKLEEIEANTEPGKPAGALAVKELNDSLKTVKTYVDEEGKLHFVDSEGADSVLPFSSFKRYYGETTIGNALQTVEVGFKPKAIHIAHAGVSWMYDETLNGYWYNGAVVNKSTVGSWDANALFLLSEITDTGFVAQSKQSRNYYIFAYA